MPKETTYAEKTAQNRARQLQTLLLELPAVCADFLYGIEDTTSALTRLSYAYDLRLFFRHVTEQVPALQGRNPSTFTLGDIQAIALADLEHFQQALTLYERPQSAQNGPKTTFTNAAAGKMRKMSSLRSFYTYIFEHKLIPANLAALIPLPKIREKPIIRLEIDEIARLLDIAETGESLSPHQQAYHAQTRKRDLALLTLMLGTGIRVSECVGVDLDDLNFQENAFRVTRKGGDQAILYFSEEVAGALRSYLEERKAAAAQPGHEHALFLSLQKRRITQRAVQNLTKKYAAVAAPLKRISPHKLRSSYGTQLYRESGDIYLVADVLGHADVNTTRKHYAAMSEERRRMASGLVKLRDDEPAMPRPPASPRP